MDAILAQMQGSGPLGLPQLMALAAALGWASGFRLYAVVFLVGASGAAGWITLPSGLHVLQHPGHVDRQRGDAAG